MTEKNYTEILQVSKRFSKLGKDNVRMFVDSSGDIQGLILMDGQGNEEVIFQSINKKNVDDIVHGMMLLLDTIINNNLLK